MEYPTLEEVETASYEQLARWYRFLPVVEGDSQMKLMSHIADRFRQLGGFTPELSKKIEQ